MADKSSFLDAKASFLSAIRGPIMMITIGVLFAVDYSAGVPFRKTWPVILIVAGLLHLFGRRDDRTMGYRTMPGPSATTPGANIQETGLQETSAPGSSVQGAAAIK
jgi:hypothetical protein